MSANDGVAPAPAPEPLTRREREILALLAQGLSGPEIAERLTLGLSSVKSHIQHLYGKLGVNSKRQAVARARELGLLVPAAAPVAAYATAAPAAPVVPPRAKHNLPRQVTKFFGREREIAQVVEQLAEHPLVTLTGSGGVGKTRLSLEVAEAVLDDFADGVWLVELAALSNPALVPQQAAAALGVRDDPGRPIVQTLTGFLREREALLVLDNCEHLLEACSRLADSLLQACPKLRLLATSREPLAVYGEAVFRVPSLPFPEPRAALSPDQSDHFAAVNLFVDRARLVLPEYALAPHNAAAVIRICQRLDGIPLALEMAAARINLLSAHQLADRLDDAFRLLTVGSRSALPRQQTLRATIDWSYQLLNEPERVLLRRLSVFAGGCTLEAAEVVCAGDRLEASNVLDVLGSLVAKSMVIASRGAGEEARYHLLETIRQYGWEMVLEAGKGDVLRSRHLDYFLKLAEEAEPALKGPKQLAWLDRLSAELANLRAAMEYSRGDLEREERGQRLVVALTTFWDTRANRREVADWLEQALARPGVSDTTLLRARLRQAFVMNAYKPEYQARSLSELDASISVYRGAGPAGKIYWASALAAQARIAHRDDDYGVVVNLLEQSIDLFREARDRWGLACALSDLAATRDPLVNYLPRPAGDQRCPLPDLPPAARNDHAAEMALYEECLGLFRELGDRFQQMQVLGSMAVSALCWGRRELGRAYLDECEATVREFASVEYGAAFLVFRGNDALADDDLARASEFYEASLQIRVVTRNEAGTAWMFDHLAEVARRQGDYQRANQLSTDALGMQKQFGTRIGVAAATDALSRVATSVGDLARAKALQLEALSLRLQSGHPIYLAFSLHGLAVVAAGQEKPMRACRLFGAAQPYQDALFFYWSEPPIWRAEHERSVAAVRAELGEAETARLWAVGEAMTLDQAVAFALGDNSE